MLGGPLVFVDIDTQRDFMEPTGALHVPGAEAIVPNLGRLSRFAQAHHIPVLATADAHTLDELDPEPFPPHCILGTPGQERIDATAHTASRIIGIDESPGDQELPPHVTIHKRRYDVFSNPAAHHVFQRHAAGQPTFVVYGVATDYCVRAAVEGLLDRGQRVALVVDAIRAVDPDAEPSLLTDFARRGVLMTVTDAVTSGSG